MTTEIVGQLPQTCHKTEKYFRERYCFIDCRGSVVINENANFGYNVRIYTASHQIDQGEFGPMVLKKVEVCAGAWVASDCVLYNCVIGEGAIVSIGSVVANMVVEPYTAVAGNPAKPIARWDGQHWRSL